MKVQTVTPNDMPWRIRYDASRCTLCGSCVAACSFRAIECKVERRRMVFSETELPEPRQRFSAVPVIRQVRNIKHYCRGCGICEKVCPNEAIRPERNVDTRHPILIRCLHGEAIKRGGRKNLEAVMRTLDKIRVAGIDVALGADRLVGADLLADAATPAIVLDIADLADHRHRRKALARLGKFSLREDHAPPLDLALDGAERAGRHARPAQGAAAGIVTDPPRHVVGGDGLDFHCFHRCTSRLLSTATISRSLG
jgi:ferredoxin